MHHPIAPFFSLFAFLFMVPSIAAQSLEDAISLIEKEDYAGARKVLRSLIAKNEKAAEACFYLGETFYQNENADSAFYYYGKGARTDSRSGLSYVGLGKLALDSRNQTEMQKQFESARRIAKDKDARIYYELGKAHLESPQGNVEAAIENLEKAIFIEPGNGDYYSVLGDAYIKKGDVGKGISQYEIATSKDKQDPKNYLKRAIQWKTAAIYDQAEQALLEGLAVDPNFAPALRELTDVYYYSKKYSMIIPTLERYTKLVGSDIEARERLVRYLTFQAREYDRAIEQGEAILSQKPESYGTLRSLGAAYYEKGMFDKSFAALTQFFAHSTGRKIYEFDYDYFIKSALKTANFEAAKAKIAEVETVYPNRKEYRYELAKAYYDKKDYPNAEVHFLEKIKTQQATNNDYFYLGYSQYYQKKYAIADSAFAKLTELSPAYLNGHLMRAKSNVQLDPELKAALAKPHYEKVVELGLADPEKNKKALLEAYKYLGYYYVQLEKAEEAKINFGKAYELDPKDAELMDILSKLNGGVLPDKKGGKK
ncbi:MAG: tetratricopeptide repeat protein [Saprospiraceae bacterium]|nr:tetratricopeptide repeat protein [Saprospiraceae bacterium]